MLTCMLLSSPAFAQEAQRAQPPDSAIPVEAKATINTRRPKIGLALGGGGTRGVAHLGVLRILEKEGISVDYIAGTSMGAIVGGLYAAGVPTDQIETMFRDKSMIRSYNTIPIPVRLSLIPVFFVPHLLGYHPYDGLYRGNKFARYLENKIPSQRRNIEQLKIPFCAVASNLLDGQPYAITQGSVARALQASSAIPALRRPVDWQGKLYVDGGVTNNLPVDICKEMGADIVIAVDVDESVDNVPRKAFKRIGSVSFRCLNMHLAKLDEPQQARADIVIHPDVNGIELLSSNIDDMTRAVAAGEKATTAALPKIREHLEKQVCRQDLETGSN